MAEIIFFILILLVLRAFFVIKRCPNCKTLKSAFSQIRERGMDEEGREQIYCKVCNHSWKRFSHGVSDGGGG